MGRQERKNEEEKWGSIPCANTNVTLDPQDSILVDQCMGLSNKAHHLVPGTFCDSRIRKKYNEKQTQSLLIVSVEDLHTKSSASRVH